MVPDLNVESDQSASQPLRLPSNATMASQIKLPASRPPDLPASNPGKVELGAPAKKPSLCNKCVEHSRDGL